MALEHGGTNHAKRLSCGLFSSFFWFCVVVEQIRNRDGKVDDNEEEEEEGEEEEGVEESFRMGNHQ